MFKSCNNQDFQYWNSISVIQSHLHSLGVKCMKAIAKSSILLFGIAHNCNWIQVKVNYVLSRILDFVSLCTYKLSKFTQI